MSVGYSDLICGTLLPLHYSDFHIPQTQPAFLSGREFASGLISAACCGLT